MNINYQHPTSKIISLKSPYSAAFIEQGMDKYTSTNKKKQLLISNILSYFCLALLNIVQQGLPFFSTRVQVPSIN